MTQLEKISEPNLRKQLDNGAQKAQKLVELLGLEAAQKSFCEVLGQAQLTNRADETKKQLRDMEDDLKKHFGDFKDELLNGKVKALIDRLKELQMQLAKVIVFVKEVVHTGPLAQLLETKVMEGVRNVTGRSSMNDSKRQQHLEEFRDGRCWCLVATDSIEEGIDIPSCNVVVRFDEFHNVKSHVQGSGRCRDRARGGLVLYFENDPDELEHQAQKVQLVAKEETSSDFPLVRHEPLHSSTDPCSGAEISDENCVKIFNEYVMKASAGKETLREVIESGRVPLRGGGHLEVNDFSDVPPDLDRQKRFVLVALERLRRGGYVDEHYMLVAPPGYSGPRESLSREKATSATTKLSPPRQEQHFSTDFLKAVDVHKRDLVASLSKFREVDLKNHKGALNECLMRLYGGPLEKDFIQYRRVEGEGKLQYKVHIPSWSQDFEAGEPGNTKKDAEQHAAARALQELQCLCDGSSEPSACEDGVAPGEAAGGDSALIDGPIDAETAEAAATGSSPQEGSSEAAAIASSQGGEGSSEVAEVDPKVADDLSKFCETYRLSAELQQILRDQDISDTSELVFLTKEDVMRLCEMRLCETRLLGERLRLQKGIQALQEAQHG
eukprot:s368_g11.t1